ncbi:GNAT family N-acetyltransferase [Paenibacillus xerothermodurans]|nr:GNAT family N-acetyltransferase [Paenibacillus xerothermodurans]
MKIALDTALPDQQHYAELVASLNENGMESPLEYSHFCRSRYVLAAYDQDKLVGMGMVEENNHAGAGYRMAVHPRYRGRDIEHYMRKLLSVNRA